MIITRTPFRISFFGGGTDYPVYYNEYGGACLSTTINRYCYISCRYLPPFFDHKYVIRYSKRELTQTIDEIQHPSVRECLKFVGIDQGVEMVHTADMPAMSGIGSSSSFTVGFLHALYALLGKMVTKRKLSFDAIHVEQNLIKENVGSQDQTAAAFGGLNKIEFEKNGDIFVHPITIQQEKLQYLQDHMLLYYTRVSRYASDIAKEQMEQTSKRRGELKTMCQMVDEAVKILNGKPEFYSDFGKLLHESWMIKRRLTSKITNEDIDHIYETAIRAGALGGKICGAGGGGVILFFVPPENQSKVKEAMKTLLHVPFRFENLGSHVAFYSV